jgi:hypothetical protein
MANRESLVLGSTMTYQSKYDDILGKTTIINGKIVEKDIVTRAAEQVGAAASFAFRDPTSAGIGESGASATGQVASAQTGRYQVKEWIESNKTVNQFLTSTGNMTSSVMAGAGSVVASTIMGVGNVANKAAPSIGRINPETKKIEGFVAPVADSLAAIKKMGDDFDELIRETFLGQIFKIKGSEILCALFCVIISLLDCKTRQDLYEATVAIKNGIAGANRSLSQINELTKSPVEVPLFNNKTIADNVESLFPNLQKNPLTKGKIQKVANAPKDSYTKTPGFTIEAPPDVQKTIEMITLLLSVLVNGQLNVPVGFSGSLWNFSQAVLGIIEQMVTQIVDEFLTKVVSKIEKKLKSMIPQMCVGNLAVKFINRIMNAIYTLKRYLLDQLKILLGESEQFKLKYKRFEWHFKELQELLAILQALSLLLKKFPELVLMCGISPCNNLPQPELDEIRDNIRANMNLNETNIPAKLVSDIPLPQGKTLDELADTLKSVTGQPNAYGIVNPNGGFHVIMPDMFKDAPQAIQNIVNSSEFLNTLGSAYTVYQQPDQGISVVYTYELKC